MTMETDVMATFEQPADADQPMSRTWHWHPDVPIPVSGVFAWPLAPLKIVNWLAKTWLTLSPTTLWFALAFAAWAWLTPPVEALRTLAWDWVGFVYLRNLIVMTAVAGSLHLYFYTLKAQGRRRRYDPRDFATDNGAFTFRNQVHDNMFWTLASGVTTWTAYEVAYLWLWANGYLPGATWSGNHLWFVALFLVIPIWSSMHFYFAHRLLHWTPLYRLAHALHHRNVTIGPWTGISMHPIEHLLYFSSLLLHFVVASHPLHMLFHCYVQALNPACSHSGYDGIVVSGKRRLALGDFFHQLHHRYSKCNYGTPEMPWDVWFGSFHDGTPDAAKRLRFHQRGRKAKQANEAGPRTAITP